MAAEFYFIYSQKPRPEPAALAFNYSGPGQSPCWAVTQGLAWPGPNRLGLARLPAQSRAVHITNVETGLKCISAQMTPKTTSY
jgi:hypothetical protein